MYRYRYVNKKSPKGIITTVAEVCYVTDEQKDKAGKLLYQYQEGDRFNEYYLSRKACTDWHYREDRTLIQHLPCHSEPQKHKVEVLVKVTQKHRFNLLAYDLEDVRRLIEQMNLDGQVKILSTVAS